MGSSCHYGLVLGVLGWKWPLMKIMLNNYSMVIVVSVLRLALLGEVR